MHASNICLFLLVCLFACVFALLVAPVRFPVYNPRRLKKWLANMKWEDWSPSRFSVLCIDHFEEHHIDRSGKFVKLREDAVPTVFSAPGDAEQRKVRAQPNSISTDETPTGFHQILPVSLTQASSEQRRRSKVRGPG